MSSTLDPLDECGARRTVIVVIHVPGSNWRPVVLEESVKNPAELQAKVEEIFAAVSSAMPEATHGAKPGWVTQ